MAFRQIKSPALGDNSVLNTKLDASAVSGQTSTSALADLDTLLVHDSGTSTLKSVTAANLIGSFEVLAVLVIVAVIVFWLRRNIIKLNRFTSSDLDGKPKNDANYIIYFELVLMSLFLLMNASDLWLQKAGVSHYVEVGSFPISQYIAPIFIKRSYKIIYRKLSDHEKSTFSRYCLHPDIIYLAIYFLGCRQLP